MIPYGDDHQNGDAWADQDGVRTEEPPPSTAVLVSLDTVQPERLTWLWDGRLPAGKLVTLDGDPSVGKSTLAVDLAAHVSTGAVWPDGAPCELGDVLILSAEDGLADTIRPRLDAAGGDPKRVHALTAVRGTDDDGQVFERPPTLADISTITRAIQDTNSRLVIVDVLMAFLPGKVDSHKDQDIRAVLGRLSRMCEDTGATVLLLRHLNKAGSGSPMYRGGGSIGIVGAARAGYLVARDPDDSETRVLACIKSNLAKEPESLSYRLESAPDADVARVVWTGASVHDAAGLLRPAESEDDRSERDEAATWLLDYLVGHGGEAPAGEVIGAAVKAGLAKHTVQRARKRAGVSSRKASMGEGWVWALPTEGDTKMTKETGHRDLHSSSPSVSPSAELDDGDDELPGIRPNLSGASGANSDARARERGTTGTTGSDLQKSDDPAGTTEAVVPVVPPHVHDGTDGTTEQPEHVIDMWLVAREPVHRPA